MIVESVFRSLKTGLDIRPIYHQKDKYIEPHIWLGILAYQMVNYTKLNLAKNNIYDRGAFHSWTTIVNKMSSMQSATTIVINDEQQQLYIKLFTSPTLYQKTIFQSLSYKDRSGAAQYKKTNHNTLTYRNLRDRFF